MITSPRYAVRVASAPDALRLTWGVFDTFSQSFVVGEDRYGSQREAEVAVARYNRGYERSLDNVSSKA